MFLAGVGVQRYPRPASPCSGCQPDVGDQLDTLRVAPDGLRERLTLRRDWSSGAAMTGLADGMTALGGGTGFLVAGLGTPPGA